MSVIQFSFWKYVLKPKSRIGAVSAANEREGALLKVRWPDEHTGYADLFPWPEFGDASLSQQLFDLKSGRISQLVEQTIYMARRDAAARRFSQNLMRGQPRVRNHYLINNPSELTDLELSEAKKVGFATVKLKCGVQADQELEWVIKILKKGFVLRLDFNQSSSPENFMTFMKMVPEALRQKIEFVEDPFPFNDETWRAASELVSLAIDHEIKSVNWSNYSEAKPPPFKVLVLKPARQDLVKVRELAHRFRLKVAVTSSLDHPVGIVHAAALCGEMKRLYPNMILDSGCFSHLTYEPDLFSQLLPSKGPFIGEVPGSGVGFDAVLASLAWTDLKDLG